MTVVLTSAAAPASNVVPVERRDETSQDKRRHIDTTGNWQSNASDDDLVAAMAGGDDTALATLLTRHGGRISGLARRMLGTDAEADDVVQETFVRLWVRAGLWQPGRAKISTWLHRVASNLAIDRLRRRENVTLDDGPEPSDPGPPPDAGLAANEARTRIDSALAGIAPRQRLAITLCHYQDLSNIEAAEIMGLSVDALESLLARGRRKLNEILEADREWLLEAVSSGYLPAPMNKRDGANET